MGESGALWDDTTCISTASEKMEERKLNKVIERENKNCLVESPKKSL